MKDQKNQTGHGKHEDYERCELCNVPIFHNPCSDERFKDVFKGKGKVLCNKCEATLSKIPTAQALKALENASEIYPR